MHRITLLLLALSAAQAGGNNYKSFDVAVYCRVYEVRIEAPSQVSLFLYDNDTFIAESFRESMPRCASSRTGASPSSAI